MKHTEKYHEEKENAEYYLVKGMVLAFNSGLINFEMIKWVLKSVKRARHNQKFLRENESGSKELH